MKQRLLCLAFLVLVFMFLSAQAFKYVSTVDGAEDQDQRNENQTLHSRSSSAAKSYSFSSVFEALHYTVVYAEVTSPVLAIHKRMGESFEEGEPLMELDNKVFEGNYLKTLALVTKFQTELEAKKRLYADDALSQFELDEGIASLVGAEADYILAEKLFASTKVKGPYKGRVVKIAVKQFELGQQGKELITLVDDDILFAKFLVTSNLFSCLKLGMKVDIHVRETGDKIAATISRISPVIDPSSSTIVVEAEIDNREHRWWAGMKARIDIIDCNQNHSQEPGA